MQIKEWNDLVQKTLEFLKDYKTSICGYSPGCYGGHCNCRNEDFVEVYELEEHDVIQLLLMIKAEEI